MAVIQDQEESDTVSLFRLNNAFAHLENATGNVSGSLAFLEKAIVLANKHNLPQKDQIGFTPAETYLNASNAAIFL